MRVRCSTAAARIFVGLLFVAAYASSRAAQEGDPAVGRIISIEPSNPPGKLKVKQRKGERPAAATVGMPVRRGYMLTLDKDARAAVYCADGKKYDLMPGPQGCPCVAAARSVIYQGSSIPKGRGEDKADGNLPVLLSPRMHMLLTTRPTIRWSPVVAVTPGAPIKYRVSMYTEIGELVWRMDDVTGTEMAYPAKAEALVRGETYKVVVQSGKESSEQEHNVDPAFTVLMEDGVKNIRDGEEAIRKLNLSADKTQLLIAEFYATRRLSSEAIEKLKAVAGTLREPAVLLMLGEVYASQGLFRDALKQYEDALALPQISSDIEGQALTLHAAGLSLERLGKREAAASRFRSAVEAYRKLGDDVTVDQLWTWAKK